ncbi:ABC transporter substrate-binding protein [Thiocapsa rosea]|uniref:Carbohydrate ABC transporter substrate-binding protein (CUT1 family) n=1 Tax=Thiocapsa rosea TaxID=69360 RepID=A0A495V956_9GAMM|nr:extracellular solute-binding protein [Thiocapsa rosea]RKT44897.1 carbohydrate ABC transporter substrate-binding protein (CUT1 family) [Thiocapsa rosea]
MTRLHGLFVIFVIIALPSVALWATDADGDDRSARNRSGASLQVITRDTTAIGGPAERHGRAFESATGIAVEVTRVPFADLYERIMLGFVTGDLPFDALMIPSAWLPDFAPYLSPVPDRIIAGPIAGDIHPLYRDALMRWDNRWMALTIDGDLHMGAYRRDLFEDSPTRAAFAEEYGRPLQPPQTWSQYRDIAAFFSGRRQADGSALAGTLEAYARDGQRIWTLFSHAAAYTNHPDHPGAMFFDPDTMVPAIDNPGWVRALNEMLELRRFGPADADRLDSEAVRTRFAAGQAAMNIDWADTGVLAGALGGGQDGAAGPSAIAGDVGFFVLPGSREVWNPAGGAWETLPAVRSVSFLAFGGWIAVVPAASAERERAWAYVARYASPEHSARDMLDGSSGINPYRLSHLEDPAPWRGLLGERQAEDYLHVLRASLSAPQIARDLRLPGYRAYIAALEDQLDRVMTGSATPEEGLRAAAADWEALTDRLGRNSQRRHYREAMGLAEKCE